MTDPLVDQDARELAEHLLGLLGRFELASSQHQRDESFVAVDATRYRLRVKLASPFGQGESQEQVASTNELQQRLNHWLAVQRELGRLAAIRLVLTPDLDAQEPEA
ncbi:MAG TPA: hypothetical protein PK668_04470 [Myxococcota bacterium]|nr:hypothetical protein [Myxococcota bacterium]HRY92114.1 hypothetical protein [Myxococcota bacterium]HSA20939.1 hypothetical protein [Myxococcota bacterium]